MAKSKLIFALLYFFNSGLFAMENIIVLLGPPGSGKGTQAHLLKQNLGWPTLAHSAIKAQEQIKRPELESNYENIRHDDWTKNIFKTGLMMTTLSKCKGQSNFILENWPRTHEALKTLLLVQPKSLKIIELTAEDVTLLDRIHSRKQCTACNSSFGCARTETVENICDACGGTLLTRHSDNAEDFPLRLAKYRQRQQIFRKAFEEQGIDVHRIDALGNPLDIHKQILNLMKQSSL